MAGLEDRIERRAPATYLNARPPRAHRRRCQGGTHGSQLRLDHVEPMLQVLQLQAAEMQLQPHLGALEIRARRREKLLFSRLEPQRGERTKFISGYLQARAKAGGHYAIVGG